MADDPALNVDSVDTTPLALTMIKESHALALAPWPASANLVQALGLEVCKTIPAIPGLGNYYIEQFTGHGARPIIHALCEKLRRAASERDGS